MMVVWVFYVLPLLTGIALSPLASGIIALSLNVTAFVAEVHGADLTGVAVIYFVLAYPQSMLVN